MQVNTNAVVTLIRQRLNGTATLPEKLKFFHEKGVTVNAADGIFFLKADPGKHSEFTEICNGLIFRGPILVCYHGKKVPSQTLEESKNGRFIWNAATKFYDSLDGVTNYMYWDEDWQFADDNHPMSPYSHLFHSMIYNIESLDPRFTYELLLTEKGNAGLYLVAMYDNKSLREFPIERTDEIAGNHKLRRPALYAFEGFQEIEDADLPKVAQDQANNKILITRIT
jgi:hypothetical protein